MPPNTSLTRMLCRVQKRPGYCNYAACGDLYNVACPAGAETPFADTDSDGCEDDLVAEDGLCVQCGEQLLPACTAPVKPVRTTTPARNYCGEAGRQPCKMTPGGGNGKYPYKLTDGCDWKGNLKLETVRFQPSRVSPTASESVIACSWTKP